MPYFSSLPFSISSLSENSMIRRVYKSLAVIGRAHESVSVIRRALNSEAKPPVKYDAGSRSSGEGQNDQTVAAIDDAMPTIRALAESGQPAGPLTLSDSVGSMSPLTELLVGDGFQAIFGYLDPSVGDDSEAEELAKIRDCYQPVIDRILRRYSSASTYDVPKDSKAEEQPEVQDSRQDVVDEIRKGSCSPSTYYVPTAYYEECSPADKFPPGTVEYWLAKVEEVKRVAAGSGTKLTPEEEEAKLRYGPCECCGKEKDHATENCPLYDLWI